MDSHDIFSYAPSRSDTYASRQTFNSYTSLPWQPSRSFREPHSARGSPPSSSSSRPSPTLPLSLMKPPSVPDRFPATPTAGSRALSTLPTPPSSDVARSSPPAEQDPSREDQDQILRDFKIHPPPLHDDVPELSELTPPYLDQQLAKREASLFFRHISPKMLQEWESIHPTLREADHVRYEYDSAMQRMIVQCMPGPIHDSVQGYFIKCVTTTMDRVGGDACEDLIDVNSGTGKALDFPMLNCC